MYIREVLAFLMPKLSMSASNSYRVTGMICPLKGKSFRKNTPEFYRRKSCNSDKNNLVKSKQKKIALLVPRGLLAKKRALRLLRNHKTIKRVTWKLPLNVTSSQVAGPFHEGSIKSWPFYIEVRFLKITHEARKKWDRTL